jgi:hypothetical protein
MNELEEPNDRDEMKTKRDNVVHDGIDDTTKNTETTEAPGGANSDDGFPSADEFIESFMNETSLWPVLVVLIGSGGAFGAAMLILAGVDRNPFAAGALLLVLGMSVDVFVQARRKAIYRNIAKLVGLLWCAAIGLAGIVIWTGIAL